MRRRSIVLALLALLLALPWVVGGEHKNLSLQERRFLPGGVVNLRDGRTSYELQGKFPAQVVVFVHGFSSPSYIWGEIPAKLREAGYATLVYDLYGRGWSDRPWADYNLDLYDHQLEAMLRKLRLRGKVHLVGLSMGGIISSEFALRHSDQVASLTLIDPAAFQTEVPAGAGLLKAPLFGDWLMQVVGNRVLSGANARSVYNKDLVPGLVEKYQGQLEYAGFKRAILSTLRHMPLEDFTARYGELAAAPFPIEIFWGEEDAVTPVAGADVAMGLVPKASLHRIGEAGHLPHYEKPQEVLAALVPFLRGASATVQEKPDERGL